MLSHLCTVSHVTTFAESFIPNTLKFPLERQSELAKYKSMAGCKCFYASGPHWNTENTTVASPPLVRTSLLAQLESEIFRRFFLLLFLNLTRPRREAGDATVPTFFEPARASVAENTCRRGVRFAVVKHGIRVDAHTPGFFRRTRTRDTGLSNENVERRSAVCRGLKNWRR